MSPDLIALALCAAVGVGVLWTAAAWLRNGALAQRRRGAAGAATVARPTPGTPAVAGAAPTPAAHPSSRETPARGGPTARAVATFASGAPAGEIRPGAQAQRPAAVQPPTSPGATAGSESSWMMTSAFPSTVFNTGAFDGERTTASGFAATQPMELGGDTLPMAFDRH